jgi:uncharacterized OsmC-like protein
MHVDTFETAQRKCRTQYLEDAAGAWLTLRTRAALDDTTVTCRVETGRGLATAGVHPKAGGSGRELCSGDMLLEAVAACAGVSLKAAATVLNVELRSAAVTVEGDVDLRGALGIAADVPVGFQSIRVRFEFDEGVTPEQRDALLQLTETYSVIVQTLKHGARVDVRVAAPPGAA